MKVVINKCYGGFSISEEAVYKIAELKGLTIYPEMYGYLGLDKIYWTCEEKPEGYIEDINFSKASIEDRIKSNYIFTENTISNRPSNRTCQFLIKAIEELGKNANGELSNLKIVEIPDEVEFTIEDYDGIEWIAEKHRVWS